MKIAHIVPSLEVRHGGPSKSVRSLANALARAGESVTLLTTQEAGNAVARGNDDDAHLAIFPRVTPRRLCRSPELRRHLKQEPYDCLHHHALWLLTLRYTHEAAKKSRIPLVISPRGMMSGWAYTHHRWRKIIANLLVHPGAFHSTAGWHATSPEEADDIRKLGFTQPICVSPNGVMLPTTDELSAARHVWEPLCPASREKPIALFYSRFHRKKRLLELIDLWLATPRGNWHLLIAGMSEEYTTGELTARIATLKAHEKITVVDGANRPPPYAIASLFVLPSHSENFGLVIAEALAAGVPALVTDTTPWQGLNAEDCGWCVPWKKFPSTLVNALATPAEALRAKGERGRAWVGKEYSWEKAARLLREFYGSLR
jgi:glycosyltransferase involved in cell wall biosynthesis